MVKIPLFFVLYHLMHILSIQVHRHILLNMLMYMHKIETNEQLKRERYFYRDIRFKIMYMYGRRVVYDCTTLL